MNIIDKYKKCTDGYCIVIDFRYTYLSYFSESFKNMADNYTLPIEYRNHWTYGKSPKNNELCKIIKFISFNSFCCVISSIEDGSVYVIDYNGIAFVSWEDIT